MVLAYIILISRIFLQHLSRSLPAHFNTTLNAFHNTLHEAFHGLTEYLSFKTSSLGTSVTVT